MNNWLIGILGLGLTGCATVNGVNDPLEPVNRVVFTVNDGLDRAILRPVAQGYDAVVPAPVQTRVTNFFSNLGELTTAANALFQAKPQQSLESTTRFVFNTTFGLAGLFDVASHMDLPKHNEDFGQTLGYWGVPAGPFLVLPLMGPSTVRDTVGNFADGQLPLPNLLDETINESSRNQWAVRILQTVNMRAQFLATERAFAEAMRLDPYAFQRDAYLQRRESLIRDGQMTFEDFPTDDFFNDPSIP